MLKTRNFQPTWISLDFESRKACWQFLEFHRILPKSQNIISQNPAKMGQSSSRRDHVGRFTYQGMAHGPWAEHMLMSRAHEHMLMRRADEYMPMGLAHECRLMEPCEFMKIEPNWVHITPSGLRIRVNESPD